MKPKNVVRVIGLLTAIAVFGSTLAYWKFPEHTGYVDVSMAIYIVLMAVFGVVMLKRSKTA